MKDLKALLVRSRTEHVDTTVHTDRATKNKETDCIDAIIGH